ncbi:GNAT family N-acetyltransferase [Glycomyces arizonensis]|uniref:GNAT family N-acetyltransferase n=1 Tax=Glycomyces arizonensis TaxID=256035 RepID=UPI0003F4E2BB|nr:GNAT family N-acetyltransferase [Glycomyces arizonensis]
MPSPAEAPNWPATITSARLTLRPAHEDDAEHYRRLWTDPVVRRFLGGPVEGERLTAYERGYLHQPYIFSVVTADGGTMVGAVNIDQAAHRGMREISYSFLPDHWGSGYAREAVQAALAWAFDAVSSAESSIIAVTQEANTRSRRLLEAIGMEQIDRFMEFDAPQTMYAKAADTAVALGRRAG